MEFLDILGELLSYLIIKLCCEFFIANQTNRVGMHIEKVIVKVEISEKDS